MRGHASSWPFLKPVDRAEVPDYYDHIKFPMGTMGDRLKNRYYIHRKLFMADISRMFSNCRHYNEADTEYCKCANALEKYYIAKMKDAGLWDK